MAGNERGAALILTLLVVVLLVALVLEFDRSTRIGLMAAGNFRDGVQAGFLAKAGVAVGRGLLKDDALHSSHYDGLDEAWAKPIPPLGAGEGSMTITIQDETGKLNPNHLVDGATRKKIPSKVAQMRRLLEEVAHLFGKRDGGLVRAVIKHEAIDLIVQEFPKTAEIGDERRATSRHGNK